MQDLQDEHCLRIARVAQQLNRSNKRNHAAEHLLDGNGGLHEVLLDLARGVKMLAIAVAEELVLQGGAGGEALFRGGLQQAAEQAVQEGRGVEAFLNCLDELDGGL